jgi:hypothetical protein
LLGLLLLGLLCLTAPARAQGLNVKQLFNQAHSGAAVRQSTTAADTLYFVQPENFRLGYGDATGFQLTVRDLEQSTAEVTTLGFVKLAQGKPDASSGGAIGSAAFSLFGTGSGTGALTYMLTLTQSIALPTGAVSLSLGLPLPNGPTDGIFVFHQDGGTTKLPTWAPRDQLTFYRDSQGVAQPFKAPASTLQVGGRYGEPAFGSFIRSTAYGAPEDLLGLEALYPDATRQDQLGYYFQASQAPRQWFLPFISLSKTASPIVSPFGTFLIDPTTAIQLAPTQLDNTGSARTGTVTVPPIDVVIWAQSALIDLGKNSVRISDAGAVRIK